MATGNGGSRLSPEERERRRQQALQLHQEIVVDENGVERRKFGGPQPGSGRPRKRAAQAVSEAAIRHSSEVAQALVDGLKENNHPSVRINAARTLIEIERDERKLELQEQAAERQMNRDEAADALLDVLRSLGKQGAADIIDGTYEVVDGDA